MNNGVHVSLCKEVFFFCPGKDTQKWNFWVMFLSVESFNTKYLHILQMFSFKDDCLWHYGWVISSLYITIKYRLLYKNKCTEHRFLLGHTQWFSGFITGSACSYYYCSAQTIIWNAEDWTQVCCRQGKSPTCSSIAVSPLGEIFET